MVTCVWKTHNAAPLTEKCLGDDFLEVELEILKETEAQFQCVKLHSQRIFIITESNMVTYLCYKIILCARKIHIRGPLKPFLLHIYAHFAYAHPVYPHAGPVWSLLVHGSCFS